MITKLVIILPIFLFLGVSAYDMYVNYGNRSSIQNPAPVQQSIQKESSYTNVKPQEAKKRLENEKGIILLDVRTREEYMEKHIPNSLLIPLNVLEKEAPVKLAEKDAVIFVYCRSGRRSAIAAEALVRMGYSRVYNLGGIISWPYETEIGIR